ncbi:MAG: xanthine dehydrogenase family protein molybdopterin-binding subunit [Candidatus Pelagadaptatus aseana]|uniref:xanthine dehydrogenase family protein molybdopterin-binding subunit n=1 Tax=Candidatus Pelagadaptatus aseana TaxID=3120508 RepID=UPI0039B13792
MSEIKTINRRDFVKFGLGAGALLALGIQAPRVKADASPSVGIPGSTAEFNPNAFISIDKDSRVTVAAKHLEMGQGTHSGLAMLVAEELDASWEQVVVIGAIADHKRYNNIYWGPAQGTGGSTGIANSWQQLRKAGAMARAMLASAAAGQWQVPVTELEVRNGVVSHPGSGRTASFGELAEAASVQAMPTDVTLKQPAEFRLIGQSLPRKDTASKINGTAVFTQDFKLPGMLTAVIAHPPLFGARLIRVDDAAAKQIAGVEAVLSVPSGVAVVARDFWTAKKGRDALTIQWDESAAFKQSSEDIYADFSRLTAKPGATARNDGDAIGVLERAEDVVEAEYRYPYLAHASMEPLNCVVHPQGDKVEVWNATQMQTADQAGVAAIFALRPEQVTVHMLFAGGSFGRRANPKSDYILETAHIAKSLQQALGKPLPVKLMWTREDDMRGGWYRPLNVHRIRATLDETGMPKAWHHRLVGQSIAKGTPFEAGMIHNGVDHTSVEGANNLPYAIPNLHVDSHSPELPVTVQWWRAVGSTHTAYTAETFIDQLAEKAGRDPVDYRLALLKNHPRHTGVLKLAAEKAEWGKPSRIKIAPGKKVGRGVAVHESFNSFVAMVADVSVDEKTGAAQVEKVVVAVDCGIAINPDSIRAQMEGGLGFGLAMMVNSAITLNKGQVVESNFDKYQVVRLSDFPDVEVHIVPSAEAPTGVGEPGTPVISPAVANAIAAATGKRHYHLPMSS